jgi:hypothetical protein
MKRLIALCVWLACVSMAAQATAQCFGRFCARPTYARNVTWSTPYGGAYAATYRSPGVAYAVPVRYGRTIPWIATTPVRNAVQRITVPPLRRVGPNQKVMVGVARNGGVMYASVSAVERMVATLPPEGWHVNSAGYEQWGPVYTAGYGGGARYSNVGFGGAGVLGVPCNRATCRGAYCRR